MSQVPDAGDICSPISGSRPTRVPSLSEEAALFRVPLSRGGAGVGAFALAVLTAGALAHVGVRLKSLEVAYDLARERHVASEMEEQRRRLQIEIGMLKDPRRVIAIAREKLSMGPPAPEAIWRLEAPKPAGGFHWTLQPAAASPATGTTSVSSSGERAASFAPTSSAASVAATRDTRGQGQGQGKRNKVGTNRSGAVLTPTSGGGDVR